MASAGKDKSFHGLLVGLGIAGTIAGVAILFAYAASSHSYYPQDPVSDSTVQDAGQPSLPSQEIDAGQSDDAASIAVADQDIADDSLQISEEPSDKSQAMQEQAPAPSENQMPEEQQPPIKPPAVTSVTEQVDANTTIVQNNSNSPASADNVAVTEEEPQNHSGNNNKDSIKDDRRQQQVTSSGIVSIGVQIDKTISPTVQSVQEKQVEDDQTESQDNSNHHDDKVKVQENDNDKKSKEDKHEEKHGDKSGKGNKDKHDEKHGKDHKEKKHHKGHN